MDQSGLNADAEWNSTQLDTKQNVPAHKFLLMKKMLQKFKYICMCTNIHTLVNSSSL